MAETHIEVGETAQVGSRMAQFGSKDAAGRTGRRRVAIQSEVVLDEIRAVRRLGITNAAISSGLAGHVECRPIGGRIKRAFDIVVAVVALTVLSPLMLATAVLIRVAIGSPIIFAHQRIGANGHPFRCYKFRTMVPDAAAVLQSILKNDPVRAEEWRTTRKLKDDPRVTWLGRFLRRTSIDELPQLFNVLLGDMSCVGPRPVVADELAPYGPYVCDYLSARPGMTGAWQVSGRNTLSCERRVHLDVDYVRDWSFWRDIRILLLTVPAVLRFDETT